MLRKCKACKHARWQHRTVTKLAVKPGPCRANPRKTKGGLGGYCACEGFVE